MPSSKILLYDGNEQKMASMDADGTTIGISWWIPNPEQLVISINLGGSGNDCGQELSELFEWNAATNSVKSKKQYQADQCDDTKPPAWTGES